MREYEKALIEKGIKYIAGTDEVGRGPLAGPVVTAAVILPNDFNHPLVKDSKTLNDKQLKEMDKLIKEVALSYSIVEIDVQTIDELNIKAASRYGMKKAIESLSIAPEHVLVDFETLDISIEQQGITKGDSLSISIAAASIIAKVHRDDLMKKLHEEFPIYGWDKNVGYGSLKHRQAIKEQGWTLHHRKSFNPVKTLIKERNE